MIELSTVTLVQHWRRMAERNRRLGFNRYDYGDIHSHALMQAIARMPLGSVAGKLLRFPEWCAPQLWRRILGIRKQLVPSVYYHLGISCAAMERISDAVRENSAAAIAEQALAARMPAKHVCWSHPYPHHGATLRKSAAVTESPPSCAHHTARVGQMLLTVGRQLGRDDFLKAGISAAHALLEYHHWQSFADGTWTVSYYPNSRDEVINTAADVLALLIDVPREARSSEIESATAGLLRMIVSEQQPDGSWLYCTQRYYCETGARPFIDGHHTAMVLKALARAATSEAIDDADKPAIRSSLAQGVGYYVNRLIQPDGKALYFPAANREAGIVGYTEGISSLCACWQTPSLVSPALRDRIEDLAPKLLHRALDQFLNFRTFDVACCRFLGRPYQIQSARWGSAPLMHAITDFVATFRAAGESAWMHPTASAA